MSFNDKTIVAAISLAKGEKIQINSGDRGPWIGFRVAEDNGLKKNHEQIQDRDEKRKPATFYNATFNGEHAVNFANSYNNSVDAEAAGKGVAARNVILIGRTETDQYVDRNGQNREGLKLFVNNAAFDTKFGTIVGYRKTERGQAAPDQAPAPQQQAAPAQQYQAPPAAEQSGQDWGGF